MREFVTVMFDTMCMCFTETFLSFNFECSLFPKGLSDFRLSSFYHGRRLFSLAEQSWLCYYCSR